MQACCCSTGHKHFCLWIVAEIVVPQLLLRNSVAEARYAIKAGIDVVTCEDSGDGRRFYRCGDRRIADALREINAADAIALGGHRADFRLHRTRSEFAQGQARRGMRMRRKGFAHERARRVGIREPDSL